MTKIIHAMRFSAMTSALALLFVFAPGAEVWSTEPILISPRLDTFEAEFRNSAASTKRRLLDSLRQELEGSAVSFSGKVWAMSEAKVGQASTNLPNRGEMIYAWEYAGMIARADYQVGELPPAADRIRHQLGGADSATLVIVRNRNRQIYALSANPQLIDRIRNGIEIEVTIRVTGMTEESLFGFLEDLSDPSAVLSCSRGRQFPSESGFRFCPFCGEILTSSGAPPSSSTQIE